MKYWPLANVTVTVTTEDHTVSENGKRSGFESMEELEEKKQKLPVESNGEWRSLFYRYAWVRSLSEALDFQKMKFPWIVVIGFLLMTVDKIFSESLSWVSDIGLIIAVIGAVQYIWSALKYARKKNE